MVGGGVIPEIAKHRRRRRVEHPRTTLHMRHEMWRCSRDFHYTYISEGGGGMWGKSGRGRDRVVGVKRGWWRSNNGNENWMGVLVRGRSYG